MSILLERIKIYIKKLFKIDKLNKVNKYKVRSFAVSFKVSIIYAIMGFLWITFSSKLLYSLFSSAEWIHTFEMYKGWLYVFITALLIFLLLFRNLSIIEDGQKKLLHNYDELNTTNEELVSIEEELRQQYTELEKNRNHLQVLEERYGLAVEVSGSGIWDWDVKNNVYFFSATCGEYLGYNMEETNKNFTEWFSLIHPEDINYINSKFINMLSSKESMTLSAEYRMIHKNGTYIWILTKAKSITDERGNVIRIVGSHTNITEQKLYEDKLNELAYLDSLTKLPNKTSFEIKLKNLIQFGKKQKFAFIYMDIDNFKNVNDTLGHVSGDLLLKEVAAILKEHIIAPDFAARLSGDEFAIILTEVTSKDIVENKIKELLQHLRIPWKTNQHEFLITFSLGVTIYPDDGDSLNQLLKNADSAMYSVKKNTKDNYAFYSYHILEEDVKQIELVNELRRAIKNEEFIVFYQPVINLKTNCLEGFEALVRWNHPKKGLILPMEFIPIAEESGLIMNIGKWVFKSAIQQKKEWEDKGFPHLRMSINVSGKRLVQPELIEEIHTLLQESKLNSKEIQIEVTETAFMENIDLCVNILETISNMGIKIALDDFGTGYSSLTYLKNLPIDVVKLDRTFLQDMLNKKQDNVIVESLIKLTHDLKLEITAEGIETENQLEYLKSVNCDYGQGFFYSRPVPKEVIEQNWLSKLIK